MKEYLLSSAIENGFFEKDVIFIKEWSKACLGFTITNDKFNVIYSFNKLIKEIEYNDENLIDNRIEEIENLYSYYEGKIILLK